MGTQNTTFRHIASLLLATCASSIATANASQLVSVANPSIAPPAGGGGDSVAPILSPDARFVLFTSTANNLSVTSSNTPFRANSLPTLNVFLRDRSNGTTTLVSVNLSGTGGGNGDSIGAEVSTNGRYALFESSANDLVSNDTNNLNDVFVRDLLSGTTHLVSVSTNGGSANGESLESAMTPDGRFVAFVSTANDLVPNDTNGIADVFMRDLHFNTTTLVSVGAMATTSAASDASSEGPDVTPDGRYVAFYSTATNLVPGAARSGDIYVRDLIAGITHHANTNAVSSGYAISEDGKYLVFQAKQINTSGIVLRLNLESTAMDLVHSNAFIPATPSYDESRRLDITPDGRFVAFIANTNMSANCVNVWDAHTGTNVLASADLNNTVTNGSLCAWPTIDPTGRFVAFLSPLISAMVTNKLSTNSLGRQYHLYVRDTQLRTNRLVNTASNGVGYLVSFTAPSRLTAGGRFIAFQAPDGNLAPGDVNHYEDIFLRDMTLKSPELVSTRHPSLPSLTPNGSSGNPSFSVNADGSRVAFASDGDNLTGGDTNQCQDVFLWDRLIRTNFLVSTSNRQYTNASTEPSINADGRYVAHVAFPYGGTSIPLPKTVLVRDLLTGSNISVSFSYSTSYFAPKITADGKKVLFKSSGSSENLYYRDLQQPTNNVLTTSAVRSESMTPDGRWVAFVGVVTSGVTNLYVWDSQLITRVYTNTTPGILRAAISPNGNRLAFATATQLYAADWAMNTNWLVGAMTLSPRVGLRFSADGRFLAYACTNTLVSGDTNGTYDVYLYDFQTASNLLVSHRFGSTDAGNDASDFPDISPNGRLVAYRSDASDLVPADNNGAGDVFLFDAWTGNTRLLSANKAGTASANGWSSSPQFTRDSRTVFFKTWATDLTDNDFNGGSDLFAYAVFYADIEWGGLPVSGPTLSWPIESGKTYRVEFLDDLNNTNWQNAGGSVIVVGDWAYFVDPSPDAHQRFYRIVAE